ncbi:MAG: GGDEF domain-containing protein [Planctomycetota bacterium]|nr:GGDEF domain-containing protein [Planctomycetota bacterium]
METRDLLTGAFTRQAFVADPAAPLDSGATRHAPMEDHLLCIDVKGLRRLIEVHGTPPTDRVVVEVTRRLHAFVGDRAMRWADDDEWLVRLEHEIDARAVAEGIRQAVSEVPFDIGLGHPERVTVSIGVAQPAKMWSRAMLWAMQAMTQASRAGGDLVREAH